MVYYQQQNVALLAQISLQVSSIAPQVSIPSSPPPPYPDFTPNPSDVRVNAYWFMSLVFSLSAALLATLVQQWVQDHMQSFQRYGNPLKGARLRQYLYDGAERWNMLVVAESVPWLIHVSLFLFFLGIIDSLFSLNTTVSITTIVPISFCALFYVLSTFAPIVDPRSPFKTPLSSLFWYLTRKLHPRTYLDRGSGGTLKTLSSDLSEGQMQLAMEENEDRKHRDVRALQWFIDNRTEDDEMDSFVVAIPGAFTSQWAVEVWKMLANEDDPPHQGPPLTRSLIRSFGQVLGTHAEDGVPPDVAATRSISHARNDPHAPKGLLISDLCRRVQHLADTCDNPSLFTSPDLLQMRARGCLETVASLVLCANVKPESFEGLEQQLRKFGEIENIREPFAEGSDGSFLTHWACLYLVAVTRGTLNHSRISYLAQLAIISLSALSEQTDNDELTHLLKVSREVDRYFETARQFCVGVLQRRFGPGQEGSTKEQVGEVPRYDHEANVPGCDHKANVPGCDYEANVPGRDHEVDISILESATPVSAQMMFIDKHISQINRAIDYASLPGVSFDEFRMRELIKPVQFFNISASDTRVFMPQIVFLHQRLRLLCSYAPKLQDITNNQSADVYLKTLESLQILWDNHDSSRSVVGQKRLMERQLWRLLDLRDAGGFGFMVELFLLILAQLLATSQDTHSTLHVGTFKVITSDRGQHKHSIGTQHVILNVICDIAISNRGIVSNFPYPEYITNELLDLLENIVEGQPSSSLDKTMDELKDELEENLRRFGANELATKAIAVISQRSQAPVLSLESL
jgi:hypothetical protein